jgi:Holliday junction resolvase RusA-like endonuclease
MTTDTRSGLVSLTIPGPPRSKHRPRRGKHGNFYTPRQTVQAETAIAGYAQAIPAKRRFKEGRLRVEILLFTRSSTLDIDNAAKLVLDGLVKGQLIADDRQVVSLAVDIINADKEETKVSVLAVEG